MKALISLGVIACILFATAFVFFKQPYVSASGKSNKPTTLSAAPASSKGIEITSVNFDVLCEFDGPWSEIPLRDLYDEEAVIISDSEIREYDWNSHTMAVATTGSDRIPRVGEFLVGSQYFLLSVNAEPCFLGAIETNHYSSEHFMPTILVDQLPRRGGAQPLNIRLDSCYVFADGGTSDDKRPDSRLKRYLKDTRRLK